MSSEPNLLKRLYTYDIVRYTTVGIINTIVIFALFFFFNELTDSGPVWSNRIGYTGGLISNYTLNKHWTFKAHKYNLPEILLFGFSFGLSYLVQFLTFRLLMDSWGWGDGVAALVAYPLYGLIFYILCKYLVFTARADQAA
ncbi:MAG: GtrA family protein [Spirochaetales bacterium]|nr:GtrA family protein [Spirochaetales bacterium]